MCDCKSCQREKDKVSKPEECSPEQIRECHGNVKKHPCAKK